MATHLAQGRARNRPAARALVEFQELVDVDGAGGDADEQMAVLVGAVHALGPVLVKLLVALQAVAQIRRVLDLLAPLDDFLRQEGGSIGR